MTELNVNIYNIRIYFIKSIEIFTIDYRYQKMYNKEEEEKHFN